MADESRNGRLGGWVVALAVTVVAAAMAAWRLHGAIPVGPEWDGYAFLANAAEFAGKGFGYTEAHRPPLLSFITSLWFRIAPLDTAPLQYVEAGLTVLGVPAIFLLLRRRFTIVPAAIGSVVFLGIGPVWGWLGMGYTDGAAIALSAWTLLAAIEATERSGWFYLLAGPLYTCAVLMRFTALLIAFPVAVWLLLRWRPFREAPRILGGLVLAVAAYLPAGLHYAKLYGDALFPFIFAFGINETVTSPGGEGMTNSSGWYYIREAPAFLFDGRASWLAALLLVMAIYGLIYAGIGKYLSEARPSAVRLMLGASALALVIVAQLHGGLVVRQFSIPLAILVAWRTLGPTDSESGAAPRITASAALDAAMLCWLATYLDFHGHQQIQIPRYFITMAVPLLYFLILGTTRLSDLFGTLTHRMVDNPRTVGIAQAAIRVVPMMLLVAIPTARLFLEAPEPDITSREGRASADYLSEHGARESIVVSDIWPITAFYMRAPVVPLPQLASRDAVAHELAKQNAKYYVKLVNAPAVEGFREVFRNDTTSVLHADAPPASLPRIAYLGSSWDSYLEQMTGYPFYLDSTAGRYGYEGSAFLDAYTAEELRRWNAVAAAGFKWKSHADGENTLRAYVEDGGVAVIDASQNLGGLAFSVVDTIMLDTVVRRTTVPADAAIECSPAFAQRHPEVTTVVASPFVDETGGVWAGASYEARPGLPPLETLVTVGGKPAVQLQRLGEGRIYWIGSNLVWHAFYTESASEAELVNAVFADALAQDAQPSALSGDPATSAED